MLPGQLIIGIEITATTIKSETNINFSFKILTLINLFNLLLNEYNAATRYACAVISKIINISKK